MSRPPNSESKTETKRVAPTSGTMTEDIRTGLSPDAIARAFLDNLFYLQARFPKIATVNDNYLALAYTVRDRLLQRWIHTVETYLDQQSRTVCYLSAEFLMGPQLGSNLLNLGITEAVREALRQLGLDLETLLEHEEEPGLGNGGLGRLAACYLDSLATLEIPSIGYGIRYEFGIFSQQIRDGAQVELTDKWLRLGNPWEIARPEVTFKVSFGGHTETRTENGRYEVRWLPDRVVCGAAYDTPVVGYRRDTVNFLRLWRAEAVESFDFQAFNVGNYYRAVEQKMVSENISKILYPNDDSIQGKELRLQQQYFFASCSLQDMIRIYRQRSQDLTRFHEKFAVQLNDTHPAISIAELMRLLVDEHRLDWDAAWRVTRQTFGYTNHTLLPEALEKWPLPLFARLLPRHLEIIYEINQRFLDEMRGRFPGDDARLARLSIIDEHGERYVRMANLACVGSHAVNGVARLHTELLKEGVLKDFHDAWPDHFSNKTNGVTPRRFMALSNPKLSELISSRLGDGWVSDLEELRRLEPLAEDPEFRRAWQAVKRSNKQVLATHISRVCGIETDPDSLFDIQVKRIHKYKRQHLNVLHIISRYQRLRENPDLDLVPRTFVFGGKAAPGYFQAKLIIRLIHAVAEIVNRDPLVRRRLRVAFIPNFNVKQAQRIYPAADLSEQISTAGKEASGTGNMKFSLNGALTIGTLDGANIEIREQVGPDNFFLFGLTAPEVEQRRREGYQPGDLYAGNPQLQEVIDALRSGFFSPHQPDLFHPLVDSLMHRDEYFLLADFQAYLDAQNQVDATYRDPDQWTRKSILNVARMGHFSSDRAIREYCQDIWKVNPVGIRLNT
ncbi:MAG: hypothetical protein RIS76_468 [Verrucomicrobiota bacterium]